VLSSTADLAQARLPRSPASSRSTMPQSCIAAQGATEHTDLDMFAPQICALRCARASCARASYACRLSPSVSPKRPRKPPGLQLHNGFSTSKGGGRGYVLQLTWPPASTTTGTARWRRCTAHALSPITPRAGSPGLPVLWLECRFGLPAPVSGSETR
jgi:hypothetical protein